MSSHHLYRHFDANGELLYVGISLNALARFAKGHRQTADWFLLISRIEIQNLATREEAIAAESEAIHREHPKFNHSGTIPPTEAPINGSTREFCELLAAAGCQLKSYRGGKILTVDRGNRRTQLPLHGEIPPKLRDKVLRNLEVG